MLFRSKAPTFEMPRFSCKVVFLVSGLQRYRELSWEELRVSDHGIREAHSARL